MIATPNRENFASRLADGAARFNALKPELELTVRDPILGVEGHVVVWCTQNAAAGPLGRCGKGGTRIAPSLDLDEVRMLARNQSLKNAAANLPLGGAKSGLAADPDSHGFEVKYRRFVNLTAPALRQNGGIWGGLGFDIGARPEHADWACDELGHSDAFTGKTVQSGGTDYDKEGIAGLGVVVAAVTLLTERQKGVSGATAAVQGLGALGAAVCRYASDSNMLIRHIADPRIGGCWHLNKPLAGPLREALIDMNFSLCREILEADGHQQGELDDVLTVPVDVLFPCAVQNVVREDNVDSICASSVVEGANNPLTPQARQALHQRDIPVIPDIIANPGGSIAAFVELTSNISNEENIRTRGKTELAKTLTRDKIAENVRQLLAISNNTEADLVDAAHFLAYERIFANETLR